jgi:hypothetical protein
MALQNVKQPGMTPGAQASGKTVVDGKGIISKKDLLRLLADKGVIPDYLVGDQRTVVEDSDIHLKEGHPEDATSFIWKDGVLREVRLPPIVINSPVISNVPVAEIMEKEDLERNIMGTPIPDDEVTRGARFTKNSLRDELAEWREIPELKAHALTEEEEEQYAKDRKL